jgi:four helix bundle protein
LHIARGSLTELETQVIISKELYKQIEIGKIIEVIHEEQRMISGMIKKLKILT